MKDYVLFMHSDAERKETTEEWDSYFTRLRASGQFQGGSAIGSGECFRKSGPPGSLHSALTGYIRIQASSLDEAKTFVEGNPTFNAGGTVEVRELPRS